MKILLKILISAPQSSIKKFEEFTVAVLRLLGYYIPDHKQVDDKPVMEIETHDE